MRKLTFQLAAACLMTLSIVNAEEVIIDQYEPASKVQSTPLTPFTGKIVKNKVRLRSQPNLDGPIVRELARGDLIIIDGEDENFYTVVPPSNTKAYVFRTFVLDNVVEGSKVNVRLSPDVDAAIIGQLQTGDKVQGTISPNNSKWLEIAPPKETRFYISKDYVENIGDVNTLAKLEKRRDDVNHILDSAYTTGQSELQKNFEEIKLDTVLTNLNKLTTQYPDFPEQVAKAKDLQKSLQDTYLNKKIQYLESKTKTATETWQTKNQQLAAEMKAQQDKLREMEEKLKQQQPPQQVPVATNEPSIVVTSTPTNLTNYSEPTTPRMAQWNNVEEALYQNWLADHPESSMQDFYEDQKRDAVVIRGIVEQYNRPVKNKPGDYVLINKGNKLPIAFLYSNKINLQDKVGQEQAFIVIPRDNKNFAYPAYFVIGIE